MKKSTIVILSIVGVILVIGLLIGGSYNSLVSKEEDVTNKASNVSVMLKRRADLIPNLVATVKGYTSHEENIITAITNARTKLVNASSIEDQDKANTELTGALNALMVVVENYPDLKASQNFIALQDELAGSENRISTARKDYNDAVTEYNKTIRMFPKNILASMFGFDKKENFEISEDDASNPVIDFE